MERKKARRIPLILLAFIMVIMYMPATAFGEHAFEPVSISEGEPVKIEWNKPNMKSGKVIPIEAGSKYIPSKFLLWVEGTNTVNTVVNGQTKSVPSYGTNGGNKSYVIETSTSTETTINVSITESKHGAVGKYSIICPKATPAPTGTNPKTVCGYLPIGQFADPKAGWGAIYTDGTNKYDKTKTPKFTKGYESVGVSLGMFGGYVQFDMGNNPIRNDDDNPYGIDFVVYGNAFAGNPEAGGVMVSNDGVNWYNLAGSRHYMDGTKKNANISYAKVINADENFNSAFKNKGIYCSYDYVPTNSTDSKVVNAAIKKATWQGIPKIVEAGGTAQLGYDPASIGWWPEQKSRQYGDIWKMKRPDTTTPGESGTDTHVGGITWNTEGVAEVITYKGVVSVPDDQVILMGKKATANQSTDSYQWGYVDVRGNGTDYGTAINPYASAASAVDGGDGFDLAWAVDAAGKPISLSSVKYVRVYNAVLFNAGVFGETSTEVSGLYMAKGEGSGAPSKEVVPVIKKGAESLVHSNAGETTVKAEGGKITLKFTSGAQHFYVNGEAVAKDSEKTFDVPSGTTKYLQVISQNGTESPYVTVIKLVG